MKRIFINISSQTASLFDGCNKIKQYIISSAANGIGFEPDSNTTPIGNFSINDKIGNNSPEYMIFKGRQATGELCMPGSDLWKANHALVLTRMILLNGLNSDNSNTLSRFIYLHGTNRENLLGKPASNGCIRFGNNDIIDLFDRIDSQTMVIIVP